MKMLQNMLVISEPNLGLKKNIAVSKNGSKPSGNGSSPSQNTNPLGFAQQVNAPVQAPFDFARQSNPELTEQVNQDNLNKQLRQQARLKQISRVYDANQGEGSTQAIKQADQVNPVITQGTALEDRKGNRAGYVYNKLLSGVGELVNSVVDLSANLPITSPEFMQADGKSFDTATDREANKKMLRDYRKNTADKVRSYFKDKAGAEVDPTLENQYDNEFITSAVGGLSNSVPAMVMPAPLRGAAMVLQGYDAGIRSVEAADVNGEVDDLTKTIYGTVVGTATGLLEKYGFDKLLGNGTSTIGKGLADKAIKEAVESGEKVTGDAVERFLNSNIKDFIGNFSRRGANALEGAAIEFGTGSSQEVANVASEYLLNAKTGKPIFDTEDATLEGLVNTLQRVAYAGAQEAVGGGLIRGVLNPKEAKQFDENKEKLEAINTDLENPDLSPEAKELLVQQKVNVQEQIDADLAQVEEKINGLPEETRVVVEELNTQIQKIDTVLEDPNVSDEAKSGIEEQRQVLEDELVNTLTAVPANETVEETIIPEPIQTTTKEKEAFTDPEITSNENVEPVQEVVVEETVPTEEIITTETVEETVDESPTILKKAEDDLSALKQVTNKVQKYQASVKRLNDALRSGKITEQQFNETKVRFDDVIADSSPSVPKITNLTKEEVTQLDNELKNENLTTNDFIEYERARAIEDVSNVSEAVQPTADDAGATTGETQTSETVQEQKIGGQNAVQEQGTGEVLQRQPEETGKRRGERIGVEQSEQREEATKQSKKEEIAKIQERRQSIKDRISQKIKDQRGNLSSGFDPSLLKDFVELGATYVEEGIVNTKDFIKRFREDAKELGFDDSSITDADIENDILKPNQPKKVQPANNVKKLDRLAHQNLEGAEIGSTASNQAREKKRGLTEDERQYQKQTRIDKLNHGADIIAEAVNTFGDDYVNGLLDYVQENASSISPDMRQTIYVSLENDLNRRLLEDPENLTLKKQEKLVADISRDYGRELARGVATGIFRQLGRNGYDLTDVTEDFFSPTEIEQRNKIEKAVQATSEDVTQEAIRQEQGEIVAPTGEKLAKARAEVKKAKEEFSAFLKKSRGNLSSGANLGDFVAQAAKLMKAYAKLGIVKIEDVLSELRNDYGEDFVQENLESLSQAFNSIQNNKEKVKKTLIDAGYGREVNVNTKEGKQKRQILDWRKLTGAEGSLDNINSVLDLVLPDKGYSKKEIEDSKQALKNEYNDLHASIIEKAINELNRRNTPKEGSNKILARRLADLYNYGLFEKENGEYDYLVNQTLGVTIQDQKLFDELKTLHKALAQVVSHRDEKGRMMSDVALSTAESTIKNMIKVVVEKVAYRDGNGAYKASVIAKNAMNVMQRTLLNTLTQLIENPYSAFVNASISKVQDALKKEKWDTKELAEHRKMLGKTVFENITTSRGDEYGGVGSAFTIKNTFDDVMRKLSPNVIYQAAYSALTGRMFLDSSDSAFKIKRAEAEFTHNLIRVLTDKSNPNRMSQQDALKYVSEQLTGQSYEQAKVLAKDLITSINAGAGKEILIDTESNINRIANDIVKDNLVNGEAMTREMVEASFKAGYTTAGTGLGHESNNFITRGLMALNRSIDSDLQDAVKRKEFGRAAMLNMYSILSRNIVSPFVGGAANWTVIGLQKMGLPVHYLDDKSRKKTAIDLSSVQGLRDLERALEARATTSRANGRSIVGGTVGMALVGALFASGQDDELDEFLRSHPTISKYLGKVVTPLVTLALAIKYDDEYDDTAKKVFEVLGDRQNVYTDKMKLAKAIKEYVDGDPERGAGIFGELVGNKFNAPFPSAPMRYQVDALDRELLGKPQRPYREPSMGFWEGFFRRGWVDLFTPIEEE